MSEYDAIRVICITLGIIGVCTLITIFSLKIIGILKSKHELETKIYIDEKNRITMSPSRTKEFHEFLKFLTTETALINFQKYRMNTDITKVNRSAIQHLISDVASETYKSLTRDNDLFDDNNLLTKEYYMRYITNIAMLTIDKLVNDAVDDIVE